MLKMELLEVFLNLADWETRSTEVTIFETEISKYPSTFKDIVSGLTRTNYEMNGRALRAMSLIIEATS